MTSQVLLTCEVVNQPPNNPKPPFGGFGLFRFIRDYQSGNRNRI